MRQSVEMSAFAVCGTCHRIRGGPDGQVDGVKVTLQQSLQAGG